MKIDGKITFLINQDYTSIEVEDELANTVFLKIRLTPHELSSALSRVGCTNCSLEVKALDRVGKKHENKNFEFEVPQELIDKYGYSLSDHGEELAKIAQSILDETDEGWIAESYFKSQNTFFDTKDKKRHARCVIRRWI
jgi:hypothetical protein